LNPFPGASVTRKVDLMIEAKSALKPGTTAPHFTLPAGPDKQISLNEYRGKRVVLMFYPADWSPVCGDEATLFYEILPVFGENGSMSPAGDRA
jgi:peroxiredoxin